MMLEYRTPAGEYVQLYRDMLDAGHLLIAGAQGSGKSTVITGLIHTALFHSPLSCKMILVDPKRVDLVEYSRLPHVLRYATQPEQIAEALRYALAVMESRFDDMARRRLKEFDGAQLLVVIDEVADLMTDTHNKRTFSPMIQRLVQLGRAARVTVIMASQICLASVISTPIKANFASRLALRTATAQDSRNIIDMKGAETLPNPRTDGKAYGVWRNGCEVNVWNLPRYDEAERARLIAYWSDKKNARPRYCFKPGRKSA